MNVTSTQGRLLAIAAGLAFAAGGLTILLGPALARPLEWEAYQWVTILIVFGTIAAGHLMADAGRAGHVFALAGFFAVFMAGTGLVVYSSVGRQVEAAGTTMMSVEDTNAKIVEKQADLAKAKQRYEEATQYGDDEMHGQTCGRRCRDWRQRAKEVAALISQLEGEIAALGPQKPVNAQAAAMADIAALFGFENRARTVGLLTLLVPFLKTLFFEVGSIVSLGFAFRHTPTPRSVQGRSDIFGQSDFPVLPDASNVVSLFAANDCDPDGSPTGPKGGFRFRRTDRKDAVLSDIQDRITRGERFESQEDLRATLNASGQFGTISRSTLSDWLNDLSGITRTPEGRRKMVGA